MLLDDPCSLLVPITAENQDRWVALSKDVDGAGGASTQGSRCEARLALTMERTGALAAEVVRPAVGDVKDGNGQVWDIKQLHSQRAIRAKIVASAERSGSLPPPERTSYAGAYRRPQDEVERVRSEQSKDEGVILDLRRLERHEAEELRLVLRHHPDINQELLLFFPESLEWVQ